MSNVIPFPQSEEKIRKQINEAQTSLDLDLMYDLFEKYEMHFELSEELALKKCWMLHQMSSFRIKRRSNYIIKAWIKLL